MEIQAYFLTLLPYALLPALLFSLHKNLGVHINFIILPICSLISGICIQKYVGLSPYLLAPITIALFLTSLISKNTFYKKISCITLFFFAGMLSLSSQTILFKQKQLVVPKEKINLVAKVVEKENKPGFFRENLLLETKFGKILCYMRRKSRLGQGDTIQLRNIALKTPKPTQTMSGNPTFSLFLLKKGAVATTFLYYPAYRIIKKSNNSLSRWICEKRTEIFEKIKEKMPRKTFAYFSNIFLGAKQKPIKKARHYFQYWGISHHLARSGLHIALFILTWSFILSLAPIPFLIKHLLLILLCTLYTLLSWTSISFIRAISIFFLYQAGKIFNKQTNVMYFLFLVALTVLTLNPIQLFFLDFQLSFALTFAIIYYCAKKRISCPKKAA